MFISLQGVDGTSFDLTKGYVRLTRGGIKGLGFPRYSEQINDTPTMPGQIFNGAQADARAVWMTLRFASDDPGAALPAWRDVEGAQRTFWHALSVRKYAKLAVYKDGNDGSGGRFINIRLRDDADYVYSQNPHLFNGEPFVLNFVADSPYWKAVTDQVLSFQTPDEGLDYFGGNTHLGPPYYVGSSRTIASGTITNPGEVEAWPIIEFRDQISAFEVPISNGPWIAGAPDLQAGDRLVLDTRPSKRTIYRYRAAQPTVAEDGYPLMSRIDMRPLQPGESTAVNATLTGSGSVTVSFTPEYERAI